MSISILRQFSYHGFKDHSWCDLVYLVTSLSPPSFLTMFQPRWLSFCSSSTSSSFCLWPLQLLDPLPTTFSSQLSIHVLASIHYLGLYYPHRDFPRFLYLAATLYSINTPQHSTNYLKLSYVSALFRVCFCLLRPKLLASSDFIPFIHSYFLSI